MNKRVLYVIVGLSMIAGLIGALVGVAIYEKYFDKEKNVFEEYYEVENKVSMSPATLRKIIDQKDEGYILVDLRSEAEYNAEHVIGAVNVPAVSMNSEEIVSAFEKFEDDKKIIVYCYSAYCMLGKQVGEVLAKSGIEVIDLNIGWSEWKYYWGIWNPGEEAKVGLDYLEKGSSEIIVTPETCQEGEFGC
jgi:rhodanese-related sulfurtransferase